MTKMYQVEIISPSLWGVSHFEYQTVTVHYEINDLSYILLFLNHIFGVYFCLCFTLSYDFNKMQCNVSL